MFYYFSSWIGDGTYPNPYRPAGSDTVTEWYVIDLRSDPTVPTGRCWTAFGTRSDGTGRRYLGDTVDAPFSGAAKTEVETSLGITFSAGVDTLRKAIIDLMTVHGGGRWGNVKKNLDGSTEIWFAGQRIYYSPGP